ncbi:MAG: type II secretion system protein [Planctomycetota bacterium]|nr:type II secretion system protein [Planctomycetota bacterium]
MVVQRRPGGRGFTLVEVIISGVILVICAGVLLTLTSQALSMHRRGEEKVVAAALLDELLGRVLTEGAEDFGLVYSNQGPCDAPFQNWEYSVDIDNAVGIDPFKVNVVVTSPIGNPYECATLVAPRLGEDPNPVRSPEEPVDREERWAEINEMMEGF